MGDGDNFDGASFHPVDDEAGSEESAPFELCGVSCDLNQAAESTAKRDSALPAPGDPRHMDAD